MSETIEQRLQAIEEGVEGALAIFVQALCEQVHPRQLAKDLGQLLDECDLYPPNPLAIRLILRAQEAAEASMSPSDLHELMPRPKP